MAMITLQNSHSAEVTVLTNNFIDNYMPEANGEFVKVYIYLLRLLSDTSVPFSLAQMADHFFLYRERYCPCPEILGKREASDTYLQKQRRYCRHYAECASCKIRNF